MIAFIITISDCISLDLSFHGSLADKESACNAGDPGLILGWERSPGEGIGYPLLCSWASLVLVYGCETWTIKKAEHQRIDAFELWCWRRLLRVPWTVRRSKQSILKAINPEYSLEGLMLKLKLQYFGRLMSRTDSLGKTLMLGEIEGGRRRR